MRNFTNTLIFEQAIDLVPPGTDLANYLYQIFNPIVKVIENDCTTMLGSKQPLSLDLLGQIELSSNVAISVDRLVQASNNSDPFLYTRSLNTCISDGGICQKCFAGTFPLTTVPDVGTTVTIPPEFIIQREIITVPAGSTTCTLSYTPDQYDTVYIYEAGTLMTQYTYTILDNVVTFTNPVPGDVINSVVQPTGTISACYAVHTTTPFVHWFAGTYGGSLVGLMGLPSEPLPLRRSLHAASVPDFVLATLEDTVVKSPVTPQTIIQYLPSIQDKLEKAVLVSLLNAIYLT